MKKKLIISIIVCMIFLTNNVYLDEVIISDWAKETIEKADEENLIPDFFNNYKLEIKRYEYALLALNLLDKFDIDIEIKNSDPFVDIKNHKYAKEIVRLYNSGVINGVGNNKFEPNRLIKREEVATLIYRLIHLINSETKLEKQYSNAYNHKPISKWAIPYVDFCFKNKIINGVGESNGLVDIAPKNFTTIQESVALIYRVFADRKLLNLKEYEDIISGDNKIDKVKLASLGDNIGHDNLDEIIEISKNRVIREVNGQNITIEYSDKSLLSLNSYDDIYNINLNIINVKNDDIFNDLYEIVDLYNPLLTPYIKKYKEELLKNNEFSLVDEIVLDSLINIYKNDETNVFIINIYK